MLFEDSGLYSLAILARDHERNILEAKARCKQGSVAPELICRSNWNSRGSELGKVEGLAAGGSGNRLSLCESHAIQSVFHTLAGL